MDKINNIKAVVFDLDGVYFENATEKFLSTIVDKYNVSKELVIDTYLKSERMQLFKKGKITGDEFWHYFKERLGISDSSEVLVELLISCYEVNPKTQNFVKTLREEGIKTAICTNNFPDRFEGLKNKFALQDYFDVMVASYDIGFTKPSEEIFKVLAERLNLPTNQILMSDDREDNVKALRSLGFEAFLYEGLEDFINKVNVFFS